MKYVDEYRSGETAKGIAARIREEADPKREYRFMEFCGGHTHVLSRWGLGDILPESIRMIHGPSGVRDAHRPHRHGDEPRTE